MKQNTHTNFIAYFAMKIFVLFLIIFTSSSLKAQNPTLRMDMEWVSSTTNTADFQVRITNTGTVPFTFNSLIIRGVHAAGLTTGTVSWLALNDNTIPAWLGWPNFTTALSYITSTRKLNYSSNGTFFTAGTAPTIPIPAGTGVIIGTFRVSTTTTWVPNSDFSFVWDGGAAVVGYINGASTTTSLGQTGSATTCIGCLSVTAPVAQLLNPQVVSSPTSSVLTGTATICTGSSTNLSVVVTGGTSPYTVTVTNGTTNFSATSASPVSIPVSPTATSTYSIVSVTGGGTGTGNTGSATVTVVPVPA